MRRTGLARWLGGVGLATLVTALAATGTPAQAAPDAATEGAVLAADSATAVPGSYLVVLKDSVRAQAATAATADALAGRFGGRVERVYQHALHGFSVTNLSAAQARRLAADPAVASVEQNQVVRVDETQTNPPSWGLDRVDQQNLPLNSQYSYTTTGSGVNVYVVDTGVRVSHQTFGGRAHSGYDFVDNDSNADDGYGHGTHVAGTIAGAQYGVAKDAQVWAVRVLDSNGSGTTAGVIAGVDWVTQNARKPAVANLSLGGGASTTLDNAVRSSIASGVTYAIAAGNSNANAGNYSPARVTEALTVGATTSTDARASYSNYGAVVDLFAPGSTITSAWNNSDTASYTGNGTSFAAPHVAGAAARYLQSNPGATPAQVGSALVGAATSGKVTNPGTGSPNKLLYLAP
ncbi:S8 family peptidase [Goodfellowiella coeruleoviolacea]|uniref:Peptidase inhibitor I9 n=1 Tax=Goodfellowiella coeruleoviolacea TaxID=334858 RepID=A0AAE3GFW9_9PSEU|nr:S8 family peptidase [Goodfellowiella coeruleoviolacea]MCP2166647.1 Peptidase inhibitor I9 [Goodfellowiella coeruleoviolacea]